MINPMILQLLKSKGINMSAPGGTPGILPGSVAGGGGTAPMVAGSSPKTGLAGFSEKLGKSFNDPLFQFGLNMLANSAPTTAPNSFGAALGKSGLQTMQQQQQQQMGELQRKLMEQQLSIGPKQPEKFRAPTEDEVKTYNLDPQKSYRVNEATGEVVQIGSSGTTVNVNSEPALPKDHRWVRDDGGNIISAEPIPGSPTAKAAEREEDNRTAAGNLVIDDIDRALDLATNEDKGFESFLPDVGTGSQLPGVFGETDAGKIKGLLKTISANVGFSELNKMRQASTTGGALGNVTEKEIGFLQALQGNVEQSQDKAEWVYNMKRLRDGYLDVIHGTGNGPERLNPTPPSASNKNEFEGFSIKSNP